MSLTNGSLNGGKAPSVSNPLSAYVPGTKAWFPDKELGWISATLAKPVQTGSDGSVTLEFILDDSGQSKVVKTSAKQLDELASANSGGNVGQETVSGGAALPPGHLPPLRNPPMLEATDDLTNLSYLNEPAGGSCCINLGDDRR